MGRGYPSTTTPSRDVNTSAAQTAHSSFPLLCPQQGLELARHVLLSCSLFSGVGSTEDVTLAGLVAGNWVWGLARPPFAVVQHSAEAGFGRKRILRV